MSKDLFKYTEKLLELFETSNLTTMEYEDENVSVKFGKGTSQATVVNTQPTVSPVVETVAEAKVECKAEVLSPIVGTFYSSPAPGEKAFVQIGDTVKEGQVLCIVEAMKVMNEINAPVGGTISEILVEDQEGVEFNQVLFRIK